MTTSRSNVFLSQVLAIWLALSVAPLWGCRSVVDVSPPLPLPEVAARTPSEADSASAQEPVETPEVTNRQTEAAEAVLTSTVTQHAENALRPRQIESRGWYLDQSVPLYLSVHLQEPRWRHTALESLLAEPKVPRETLAAGAHSTNPEVQATALVGLVRGGEAVSPEALGDLVRDGKIAPTTQAALIEALASLEHPEKQTQIELLFQQREARMEAAHATDPAAAQQLGEQWWAALAATSRSSRTDRRFVEAFPQSPPLVQANLLDLMLLDRSAPVPPAIVEHFAQSSPEAIRRLGLWEPYLRTAAPLEVLRRHVRSPEFKTRESAVIGLGREGSAEARQLLSDIGNNAPTLLQVAAVTAWGLIGQHEQWPRLAEADSWRVRLAVAQWVPLDDAQKAVHERLQQDDALQVRQAMEKRLGNVSVSNPSDSENPPETIGALAATEPPVRSAPVPITPEEAVAILQWIDDAQFAPEAAQREAAQAELTSRPEALLAALTLAAEQLTTYDNAYLFQELLPSIEPAFQALLEVGSHSESLSIKGLRKLRQLADPQPLPELVLWRIKPLGEDFSVSQWHALLEVIHDDGRQPARQMAAAALQHPAPQVRLAACDYVAQFPEGVQSHHIEASLQDEIPAVRIAAIGALLAVNDPAKDIVFVEMLTDRSIEVQLAAAQALDRLGEPRGVQHLYRMTYDTSRKTRLLAAQTIAARGQAEDLSTLIRLLDDETPIKAAALGGLRQIIPSEEQPVGISERSPLEAQCEAWKQWFQRYNQTRA